jgi:hypothetical protein
MTTVKILTESQGEGVKKYNLPREFAEKWVSALRSEKYNQAYSCIAVKINSKECYCVLGIAGIVSGLSFDQMAGLNSLRLFTDYNNIPFEMKQPAGIRGYIPNEVSRLNDEGCTFPEIADWIEANIQFV